jgi:hypothetical protein
MPDNLSVRVKPWYASRTIWTATLAALVSLPPMLDPWLPFVPDNIRSAFAAVGVVLAALAAVFAKIGGPVTGSQDAENTEQLARASSVRVEGKRG